MVNTISNLSQLTPLPKIETEILLGTVLGKDRSFLNAFPETKLTEKEGKRFFDFVARRQNSEPLPYILGFKEFYGRPFAVNQNVLIPRPETEDLVEKVLEFSRDKKLTVVDVGTGSGAIGLTLKLQQPTLKVLATDISETALTIARKNSSLHKIFGQIKFMKTDLIADVQEQIDIIVCNLPYIPTTSWEKLPAEIRRFEPRLALDSGASKETLYQKLFFQAKDKLARSGKVFYELDGLTFEKSYSNLAES